MLERGDKAHHRQNAEYSRPALFSGPAAVQTQPTALPLAFEEMGW
jgi:hypothetical protein